MRKIKETLYRNFFYKEQEEYTLNIEIKGDKESLRLVQKKIAEMI